MIIARPLRIFSCAAAVSLLVSSAQAGQLRLAWNPNLEPDVAGYLISYGTRPGVYDQSVDIGLRTDFTLDGLADGQRYYVAVRAYTAAGLRSDYSAETSGVVQPASDEAAADGGAWLWSVDRDDRTNLRRGQHRDATGTDAWNTPVIVLRPKTTRW
jgi:hypothetical protein